MTREEAINWLKAINTKEFGWDEFALQESQREIRERCEQGVREAIDMAIKALQADVEQTDKYPWEAIPCEEHYKLPGHDEVMEALDKLTIRKVTDKDETEYLNQTFRHDDGEWHDLTDTLKGKPRLVDANDLMDNLPCLKIKKLDCDFCSFYKNKTSECLLEKWIGNAHTVSARPHGEWIRNELWGMPFYRCSVCGFHGQKDFDFCPACGNEMIGESEDK